MDIRIFAIFSCALAIFALAGCQESAATARPNHDIDSISRNVNNTEGGSVNDATKMQAPPIRPNYVEDR